MNENCLSADVMFYDVNGKECGPAQSIIEAFARRGVVLYKMDNGYWGGRIDPSATVAYLKPSTVAHAE